MKKSHVLIVDDHPGNIVSLTAMLDELDINIITACSGNEALSLLLQYDFAVVLLDVQMPEMDGFEVAELMRARKQTSTIPIIFITAINKDQEHIFKGYESGAVDYIFKPIEKSHIIRQKIKVFCDLHRVRKESEETADTLRLSEKQWQITFDAIDDLVTIHDDKFTLLRANKAMGRFFHKKPEEIIGKKCYEIFCSHNSVCENCPTVSLARDLQPHTNEVFHPELKKTFLVSASPIFNEDHQYTGIIHIAKDITERINLENQLRQAQKMEAIGTLAGGIAHDFNNLLTPIIGQTELLRLEAAPESRLQNSLDVILRSAERATQLVRQILSFSRQHNQEMIAISIQSIIKEALKLLRSSLPSTIAIRQEIEMDCGAVMADPTQIHQLMMNLCTNSSHAMAEHGGVLEVTLASRILLAQDCHHDPILSPGPYVSLEIRDTGCGIEPDIMERIFEPYFTTKEKDKGTGLGLSVVHGIVAAHKGNISAESKQGKGSTFRILLPMISRQGSTKTEIAEGQPPLPNGTEHILVVDDEPMVAQINAEILNALGYQVTMQTSSIKALELFQLHGDEFDLVITDLTMPKMTGMELTREILTIRPEMPIILCTGYRELLQKKDAEVPGIREYLYKPVVMREMAVTIRRVLDKRDTYREPH